MSKQLKAEELRFKWPEAPASKVQAMYSVIINSKLLHEEMLAKKYITLSVLNSFDDGIVWERHIWTFNLLVKGGVAAMLCSGHA
jgi:hypothetical protein